MKRRKILIQGLTLGIALMVTLSGCTRQPTADIQPAEEKEEEYALWTYDGGACSHAGEKVELVTAHADANGNIQNITDTVTLRGIDGEDTVLDTTNLTDLTNKDGNEEFEQKDGDLYIQNLGDEIHYEGTGTEELPVSLHVQYYLDGEEITPEKIKGKSGHVEIEYSLENNTKKNITAEGRSYEMAVPFIAVTLVTLPEEGVSNVEVRDCKQSSIGGEEMILGYTMPGLKDSLDQLSFDKAAEIDIPETFSISMDAVDFAPVFSTTIVTSGLLDDSLDLKDLDELAEDLTDLADATGKLVDATGKIQKGMKEYQKYLDQFMEGVDGLSEGTAGLLEGISVLDKNKKSLYDGAKGISDGIDGLGTVLTSQKLTGEQLAEIDKAISGLQKDAETLQIAADDLAQRKKDLQSLRDSMADYIESVESVKDSWSEINWGREEGKMTETARDQAREEILDQLEDTVDEETAKSIADSVCSKIDLSGSTGDIRDACDEILTLDAPDLSPLEVDYAALEEAVSDMNEKIRILSKYGEGQASVQGVYKAYEMIRGQIGKLSQAGKDYTAGVKAFNEGLGQLKSGAADLDKGTGQLAEGGGKLSEGYETLLKGFGEYKKGIQKFYDEGILKLKDIADDDIPEIKGFLKAMEKADRGYQTYSGLEAGQEGSVTFIIETEEG